MFNKLLSINNKNKCLLLIKHLKLLHTDKKTFQHIRSMSSTVLDALPKVEIDPSGVFKYILIKVYDQEKNNEEPSLIIVRGYKRCNYHSDIFDERCMTVTEARDVCQDRSRWRSLIYANPDRNKGVQEKLNPLDCEPLGGGRISHEPDNKKIHIYGYSQGYGKADHEITAKLIKDAYPSYTITISDEGY